MLKQGLIDRPRSCQRLCGQFKINRVPERNGSDNEIQPAGAVALVFKRNERLNVRNFPFLEVSRLLPRSTAWEERLPTAMRGTVPQSRRHLLAFASLCEARGKACCVPQGVEVMAPSGGTSVWATSV